MADLMFSYSNLASPAISSSSLSTSSPTALSAAALVSLSTNEHQLHSLITEKEVLETQPLKEKDSTTENKDSVDPVRMKRLQIAQACDHCKRLHAKCSEERPCKRCEATGLADSCTDTPRRVRGRGAKSKTKKRQPPKPKPSEDRHATGSAGSSTGSNGSSHSGNSSGSSSNGGSSTSSQSTESNTKTAAATETKPLDELLPPIPEFTCPDPLNDDTDFLLKVNPIRKIFHNTQKYEGLHLFDDDDYSLDCDDELSQFHWQTFLSPSYLPAVGKVDLENEIVV